MEERSQALRGSRLNQCPLLSVSTLSSWSLAWNGRCGEGDEVGGVFPGLSRGAKQGTGKEAEAGGEMVAASLVVTVEEAAAAAGSLSWGAGDVVRMVTALVPTGLPFCLTLSLPLTVSLLTSLLASWSVHSFAPQPCCW